MYFCMVLYHVLFLGMLDLLHHQTYYRSGMVNSKSFVSTDFLFNEWKYELSTISCNLNLANKFQSEIILV